MKKNFWMVFLAVLVVAASVIGCTKEQPATDQFQLQIKPLAVYLPGMEYEVIQSSPEASFPVGEISTITWEIIHLRSNTSTFVTPEIYDDPTGGFTASATVEYELNGKAVQMLPIPIYAGQTYDLVIRWVVLPYRPAAFEAGLFVLPFIKVDSWRSPPEEYFGEQKAAADKELTIEEIKNATIYVAAYDEVVQLKDGQYLRQPEDMRPGTFEETGKYLRVSLYDDNKVAFGDLNEDGLDDAAAIISSNGGGSGSFRELVLLATDENGEPGYFASEFLGDRVKIESISIPQPGQINLNMVVHGFREPMCCPTKQVQRRYIVRSGQLIFWGEFERRETEQTATWQMYRNEEHRFEMKVPDGWTIEENPSSRFPGDIQAAVIVKVPKEHFLNDSFTNMEIRFLIQQQGFRLRKESPEDTYHIEKRTSINGTAFQVATWAYTPPMFGYEYSTLKNGILYSPTLIFEGHNVKDFWDAVYDKESNSFIETMDRIMSTLRFTE